MPVLRSSRRQSSACQTEELMDASRILQVYNGTAHACYQVRGITDAGLKPRRMKKVAVLGGGLMGSGIATASALAGMDVLLKEVNEKFLEVRARARALLQADSLGLRRLVSIFWPGHDTVDSGYPAEACSSVVHARRVPVL